MPWIINKIEKDNAGKQPGPMLAEEDDIHRVVDWMMRHPGQASSIHEARAKLAAEEREAERKAVEERKKEVERRVAEERAEREAYAVKHFGKNIVIAIAGRRLSKMSGFKDLKCDKCGTELPELTNTVICACGRYEGWNPNAPNTLPYPLFEEQTICPSCGMLQYYIVQVVF